MAAIATISNKDGLIQRVCVARDEQVGVYGFVFHRGKHSRVAFSQPQADIKQTANGYRQS